MTFSTSSFLIFFFNDTATTEIYTLSLHDALPISLPRERGREMLSSGGLPQQRQQAPLFCRQLVRIGVIVLVDGLESARKVGGDDRGMDVALLRDRGRVAELVGDPRDGADQPLPGCASAGRACRLTQESRGEDGAGPGAEILGREILAGDLLQVLIDVSRVDGFYLAVAVDVLEELLTSDLEEPLDDSRHPAVVELEGVLLSTLAPEGESDLGADDVNVPVAQGRQPVGAVLLSVLIIPDADSGIFQQADDGREHLRPRQVGSFEVAVRVFTDLRQRLGKGEHAVVLDRVADLAPARVVAILLSPARVTSGRLEVAAPVGTDPDVGPGGRYGEALDPADGLLVADGAAVAIQVGEPLPHSLPPDSRRLVGHVAQPRGLGRRDRVDQLRRIGRRAPMPGFRNGERHSTLDSLSMLTHDK